MVNGRRILVVEDNELNLKLVRDVLCHAGFEVLEARSGEAGAAFAAEYHPDLVLMDLQLPGIDGVAALKLIRRNDGGRRVPVIAVTAFAMRADRERALRAGFDGYVVKPISVRDLPGHVRQLLDGEQPDE
jgi:two-component system, cell cycle response regulator DivK